MDLKGFKKISDQHDHVVMQHPKGHQIRVMKKGLTAAMRKQLDGIPVQKLAEGGAVDEPSIVSDVATAAQNVLAPAAAQFMATRYAAPGTTEGDVPGPAAAPAPLPMQTSSQADPEALAPSAAPAPQSPLTGITPELLEQQQADLARTGANLVGGIYGEGAAQQGQAMAQEPVERGAAGQEQQFVSDTAKARQKFDAERLGVAKALAAGEIDPHHFINSMSTGSKIATAIGIFLGGLGGGGGANQVLDFVNKQIDRDIEAQRSKQGNARTLLETMSQVAGGQQAGAELTRSVMRDVFMHKMNAEALKYGGPMALAKVQQAGALAEQQTNGNLNRAAIQNAMLSGLTSNPTLPTPRKVELMKAAGLMDPEEYKLANKEAGLAEKTQTAHKLADVITDKLSAQQTAGNRVMNPIQSKQAIGALRAQLIPMIMEANPSKRLTEEALGAEIDPLIQKFTTNPETAEEMRSGIHRLIDANAPALPTLEGKGIAPAPYQPRNRKAGIPTKLYPRK